MSSTKTNVSSSLCKARSAKSSTTFLAASSSSTSSTTKAPQNQSQQQTPQFRIVGICGSIGSGKSYASSLLVSKLNSLLHPSISYSHDDDHNDEEDKDGIKLSAAYHIDTDKLAHGVYKPGSKAIHDIEMEFGSDVIYNHDGNNSKDGKTVNRQALGAIVFSDPSKMAKLEQIVWPHVKDLLLEQLQTIQSRHYSNNNPIAGKSSTDGSTSMSPPPPIVFVIVEAAVLLDANWDYDNNDSPSTPTSSTSTTTTKPNINKQNYLFDAVWVVKASTQTSTKRLVEKRGMEEQDAITRIRAQYSRRGIGNLDDEMKNGFVTGVIENNDKSIVTNNNNNNDGGGKRCDDDDSNELWENMKQALMDPNCWKEGRCPPLDNETLKQMD